MEGVNILNIIESNFIPGGVFLLVLGGLLAVSSVVCIIIAILDAPPEFIALGTVTGLIALIMIVGGIDILCHSKTKYEVTIDDSVNFTEFVNKYEVVEQRGQIYVVTERK